MFRDKNKNRKSNSRFK